MGQNIPNSLNGSDFQIAIWQMNGIQCFVCVRHLSRSIKLTQCNGNLYGGNINSNCHQFVLASFILYRARQWSVVFHSMRRLNNNHRRSLSDLFFHILLGDFVVVDGIFLMSRIERQRSLGTDANRSIYVQQSTGTIVPSFNIIWSKNRHVCRRWIVCIEVKVGKRITLKG